ncbi:unnamed protein product [Adineta steineri]|uniref:Uncharacterized protein n=1 Tax=Adineta steineri TaxID=433720 RepID=A0A819PB78_9BILA|nr:unnamed protein product [Adineta steineri]CAF4011058.1 unnamed protein product [Adineta steineri]
MFCWFDDVRSRLFSTFRTNILVWEIKPEGKNRIVTHDRPIVAARYLVKHKQVMVVCQAGDISFWSLEGQRTNRFSEKNFKENIDTTCLAFDEFGEKFYTGGSDGKIRIWNYNGRVTRILDVGNSTSVEITQIETLKRRILAVGWSKYLTVFRDLQQMEGKPGVPTEWKGDKNEDKKEGHDDDIVCMSVTTFSPQLLATGSSDGEICIWNTSSELFIRRLDQRKRPTNNSQTQLQDNSADFAITTLCFLDKRITSITSSTTGANLSSCGGLGFVRFWNAHTGKLIGEFQAHNDVSTIIMEIDARNKYLGTGDLNGLVKIWDIEQYCLQSNSSNIETNLPSLVTEFTAHSDSITCIDFLEKDTRTLILTSSSDCSVVLSDINGNAYGIFGQPHQWRLDVDLSKRIDDDLQLVQSQHDDDSHENSRIFDDDSRLGLGSEFTNSFAMTDEEMLTKRPNVWESTSIGVSYQEKRTNRRQRNQPTLITTKDYVLWEKTGLAPGGAYGSLETYEPPVIPEQKKTVHSNPNSAWRLNNTADDNRRRPVATTIGGNLKSAFDERSIFPKYILDYENKQRQLFELTNQSQPSNTISSPTANTNPPVHMRQAADTLLKLKRQSSTSTPLNDQKAQ